MHAIDYSIILIYLCVLVAIGLILRRKASKDIDAYFLGGRSIPWWVLGTSGMASNLDMAGTMVIISFFYIIGVKGFWIELRGGVVLPMAFFMVMLGKWQSRANVLTIAEWMEFRFGRAAAGQMARLLSAVASVVFTVGMVAYFVVGAGKFLSLILPFSPETCAVIMIAVALFYTVISGLYGVAYIDFFQSVIILFAIVFISLKAFLTIDLAQIQSLTPIGWTDILLSWKMAFPEGYEIYNLFGLTVAFYIVRVFIEGFGGPQSYMAQRYFAVKTDREAGLLSALWTFLLMLRWPFIMGVAILGLTLGDKITDPEMIMPAVLVYLVPVGFKGIVIAALVATALSTFDSVLNAGAAYLTNDIYYKFFRPTASRQELVRVGYVATVAIVLLGIFIGAVTPSINAIWGWITMSLGAGLLLPLFLRWYWWRFNGYGFAIGTGAGIIGAILQKLLFPGWPEWTAFLVVSLISVTGMFVSTFLTPATPMNVLVDFYKKTRPFGLWTKVRAHIDPDEQRGIKQENRRDLLALACAIPWQVSLFLTPVHFVMHRWDRVLTFGALFLVTSVGLYFFWYKHLNTKTN